MKCPNCNQEMEFEDTRVNTDRGTYGSIVYWCDTCDYECDEDGNECCERFYKIGIKEGRLDKDNEILKIINKWVVGVNDKGIILEIKKQLTKEEAEK